MIKRFFVIAVLFISTLTACEETSVLCGGNDPDSNLPWLKLEIERLSLKTGCNSISRSVYKDQTVFIFSNCDPNTNSIPLLFNCDGNQLNLSNTDYQELRFTGPIELIWKSN